MPPMNYNFRMLQKEGFEKGEAHEMVPVAVGEEKIIFIASFLKELISATPHSGPRIHDDNIITLGPNFQAGGIPSVPDVLRPGNRYGASCAPASNNH